MLAGNGPVVGGVAVCIRVGMCFCKVLVDGQDFCVTIKLSRWRFKNRYSLPRPGGEPINFIVRIMVSPYLDFLLLSIPYELI